MYVSVCLSKMLTVCVCVQEKVREGEIKRER